MRYRVHRVAGLDDAAIDASIDALALQVRAFVTGGNPGADASWLARLPTLEIVPVSGARGSIVDEDALCAAIRSGTLGGAALDVFADEPRVPAAPVASDRVIRAPHIASATTDTRRAMAELVLADLDAHMAGRPPLTPVM